MLTKKQEGFAQDVAAGMTRTDAYRANYETTTDNEPTVWEEAHRLAKHPDVSLRIKELVDAAFDGQDIEKYVLGKLKSQVESGGNQGATVGALKLLGQTQGMFREVQETSERTMSIDDLISNLAGDDDTLKAQLQARFSDNDTQTTH